MKRFTYLRQNQGFTLIEVLTVIIILGILIAVASATFLSQKDKANAVSAKQSLTTAAKSATGEFLENGTTFPVAATLLSRLQTNEPSITFISGSACNAGQVSVNRVDNELVKFCTRTSTGVNYGYTLNERGNRTVTKMTASGVSGATTYRNFVLNPSFEIAKPKDGGACPPANQAPIANWDSTFCSGGGDNASEYVKSGNRSLRLHGTGLYANGLVDQTLVGLTVGQRYLARVDATVVQGVLYLWTSNVPNNAGQVFQTSTGTGAQTLQFEFIPTTTSWKVWLFTGSAGANDIYVDNIMVTPISSPGDRPAYFDGDYPNATWSNPALPHQSESTTTWPGTRPW